MRIRRKTGYALCLAGLLLLGASAVSPKKPASPEDHGHKLAVSASFRQEDGIALNGSTIRFSSGECLAEHPLDGNGTLHVPSLPRNGDLTLTVLDHQEQVQGTMTLQFSEGAVIDATTDANGVGHITSREDTEELTLLFVLKDDGSLQCTLQLDGSTDFHPRQEAA